MSVVGSWSEQEIRASYTPSGVAIVITLVTIVAFGVAFGVWRGNRKKEFLLAWGAAVLFGSSYVYLAQRLARALCIDAPLYVKVHGILNAPFFLGTKDAGLLIVVVLFAVTNILALNIRREFTDRLLLVTMINGGLLFFLSAVALGAYIAVGFGVGLPTE